MLVTKIEGNYQIDEKQHLFTQEQLQKEYHYVLAQTMLRKMLDKGLISSSELDKITELNRKTYYPFLADITPSNRSIIWLCTVTCDTKAER